MKTLHMRCVDLARALGWNFAPAPPLYEVHRGPNLMPWSFGTLEAAHTNLREAVQKQREIDIRRADHLLCALDQDEEASR